MLNKMSNHIIDTLHAELSINIWIVYVVSPLDIITTPVVGIYRPEA